jgi:crotonobetainyl-CoA:carnitine CoA-transferase CaiB-like acyl-CoA transferase
MEKKPLMSIGQATKPTGPLSGLKVIDLSHVMAGPVCGMMLADMGAEVIKVEKIPGGDDTRRSVPPAIAGESAAFMMMNRNKRGIALDLKSEAGHRALLRLINKSDILIENYRKGALDRLGLGFDALHVRPCQLLRPVPPDAGDCAAQHDHRVDLSQLSRQQAGQGCV